MMLYIYIYMHILYYVQLASSPGLAIPVFSMLHAEKAVFIERLGEPRDKANVQYKICLFIYQAKSIVMPELSSQLLCLIS